jgi:bromodomain-containing factor 1
MSKFALSHLIIVLPMLTAAFQRIPLQNGHKLNDSFDSPSSANTSAHQKNLDVDTHDFAPTTNGVVDLEEHYVNDTQTSADPSSDLPNSGGPGDVPLESSSQSVPDDMVDQSSLIVDKAHFDPVPTIVQQPTSDLREETQPASAEETAVIKEHKQQQDLIHDPELANAVTSGAMDSSITTTELDSSADPLALNQDTTASLNEASVPLAAHPPVDEKDLIRTPSDQFATIPNVDIPDHASMPAPEDTVAEAPRENAPSAATSADVSAPNSQSAPPNDQVMQDTPPSPAKLARAREDDDFEDGPAAKRSKTEDNTSTEFKVPERPAINTQINGAQTEDPAKESRLMTTPQYKAIQRVMQNIKRVQAATPFRLPVDPVALNIPSYPTIISKPMDLRTLEDNLKAGKYQSVEGFVADFNQIVDNSSVFNGANHTITGLANQMKASFEKQMEKVPGPEVMDSSPADKKRKSIIPPAPKVSAPRRESRSSLPGAARSPVSTASTPTFALGPQGVPLIRRDSTLGDGRPKREIHPPAPRDLPYANQKPKKKKYQYELKFCDKLLSELSKPRYARIYSIFSAPVDPVALNIPTYHSVIKKPMDFGTMKTKLDHGEYENAKEFEIDARQVFQNCYKFNGPLEPVHLAGKELESIFDSEWAQKRDWVEANTPASGNQSPGSSEADDSDEEDEEDEEEDEAAAQLSKLQQQIARMSRQVEMITQKKKSPPVSGKKATKNNKSGRKDIKKAPAPAKVEKKAAPRPPKKVPYITYEQKQDISNRINSLSETKMSTALDIIRRSMPNLKVRPHLQKNKSISIKYFRPRIRH